MLAAANHANAAEQAHRHVKYAVAQPIKLHQIRLYTTAKLFMGCVLLRSLTQHVSTEVHIQHAMPQRNERPRHSSGTASKIGNRKLFLRYFRQQATNNFDI